MGIVKWLRNWFEETSIGAIWLYDRNLFNEEHPMTEPWPTEKRWSFHDDGATYHGPIDKA